jgi:hypothetical protein
VVSRGIATWFDDRWLADPCFARLREPGVLETLPVEERDERLAPWNEVDAPLNRAAGA